ncbi:substrate-binding domain-containing protein [Kangiella sediminilitoris]|uniref:OmpA/MotB domain protein n=1 Tax=Kangiella sediminilitoris TaxID=1144748 RepID=A0A1B3BDJ9_9GAMM|nr:phosphate ABC transporter substrate-binding/OmpA family protein [Kangiella sediminilitoris]AOE50833.1 OmpA/MotB domain protein [Kangiella sediminilitoris]
MTPSTTSRLFTAIFLWLLTTSSLAENVQLSQEDSRVLSSADVLFTMKGSNTIGEKLAPALAAQFLTEQGATQTLIIETHTVEKMVVGFMANGKIQAIDIKAHGSSTGFNALAEKDTDIAMASRRVKEKERQNLKKLYGDLRSMENEYTIAVDGLAVIIHPELNIKQLTTKELAMIFSGEVTNWQQLGGSNQPISVFARDDKSGTYDTFKSLVLKRHKVKLSQFAKRYESSGELSEQVSSTFGAIGFVALPYVNDAKTVAVSEPGVALSFKPNRFTVSTEDYVLSRRLYLYHPSNNTNPHAKAFMDFVLNNKAQTTVEDNNLISLKVNDATVRFNRNYPPRYLNMIRGLKRLSITFHFDQNLELDNKAKRDIQRLTAYVKNRRLKNLFVFGFSADSGNKSKDKEQSEQLADHITDLLKQRGVNPFYTQGYGSRGAIASNSTSNGKAKNQRVEIWITR